MVSLYSNRWGLSGQFTINLLGIKGDFELQIATEGLIE